MVYVISNRKQYNITYFTKLFSSSKYFFTNKVLRYVTLIFIRSMDANTKLCQGKDIFERMNYLYQASYLMALKNRVAASYYGNIMVGCAKKSVLRIESDIKRTICKCCQSPLIPGETARVRLVSKPVKSVKWTCLTCLSVKRYPTKKGHKLWIEQPNSVVQVFNYAPKSLDNKSNIEVKEKNLDKGKHMDTEKS